MKQGVLSQQNELAYKPDYSAYGMLDQMRDKNDFVVWMIKKQITGTICNGCCHCTPRIRGVSSRCLFFPFFPSLFLFFFLLLFVLDLFSFSFSCSSLPVPRTDLFSMFCLTTTLVTFVIRVRRKYCMIAQSSVVCV